jgi:hypothetical protein
VADVPVISRPSTSVEYIRACQVAAKESGAIVDPTGGSVKIALPDVDVEPIAGDFNTAAWETDATFSPPTYYARFLFGSGSFVKTNGVYDVWVEVVNGLEIVRRRTLTLIVT